MRWLFYASGGEGIGCVCRALALARQIRARDGDSQCLFLTDSEATNLIWQENFTSVKLVPGEAVQRGLVKADLESALNPALVVSTFASFQPDILVVDAYPIGRGNELYGLFPNLARRVLIYREQPESLRDDPAFRSKLALFQLVIAPYEKLEIKMPSPPGLPDDLLLAWSSNFLLRSRDETYSRVAARDRLGLPDDAFIVYVGLGGDDRRYEETVRWAIKQADRHPEWIFAVLVPPPDNPMPVFGAKNVVSFSYFPLAEVLPAFDAGISAMGSYASGEILHHGVPSVFVVPAELSDDYTDRAARIKRNGAGLIVSCFDDKALDVATDQMADEKLRASLRAAAQKMSPRNGAEAAAAFLHDWVQKSAPPKTLPRPLPGL